MKFGKKKIWCKILKKKILNADDRVIVENKYCMLMDL